MVPLHSQVLEPLPPETTAITQAQAEAGPSRLRIKFRIPPSQLQPQLSSTHRTMSTSTDVESDAGPRRKRSRSALDVGVEMEMGMEEEGSDEEYQPSTKTKTRTRTRARIKLDTQSPAQTSSSPSIAIRGGGKRQTNHSRSSRHSNSNHTTTSTSTSTTTSRRVTRSKANARRALSPSEVLTTSLEDISLEDRLVRTEVGRLGLQLRDVQGDGNCLFRCMSDQLWGTQKRHLEVRKLVCDYLQENKESMQGFVLPFMKEDEGYEGYVTRMRQQKQFGSHIEIQAAARVFKRNIRVVMSTASFTIPWQSEWSSSSSPPSLSPDNITTSSDTAPSTPAADPATADSRRTRSKASSLITTPSGPSPSSAPYAAALAEYIPPIKEGQSMLWLALFSQAEHFQSVRRKAGGDGPAEVEDDLAIPHEKDTSEAARRQRGELDDDPEPEFKVSGDKLVDQLLKSLPPRHGISAEYARGILARVKGDLGEAVEILLEEIDQTESENGNESGDEEEGSDQHVERLLSASASAVGSYSAKDHGDGDGDQVIGSPTDTNTTATASRSRSRSASGSEGSEIEYRSESDTSGCTTQSEGYTAVPQPQPHNQVRVSVAPAHDQAQRKGKALSQELEQMDLGQRKNIHSLKRIDEKRERRRSRSSRIEVIT